MLKRILSALPIGPKVDDGDNVPTPDISRVFPDKRAGNETIPDEDVARDDAASAPLPGAAADTPDEPAEADAASTAVDAEPEIDPEAWLAGDVATLETAFEQFSQAPNKADLVNALYRAAHNLRGTAEPCGAPVVARLSGSLSALLVGRKTLEGDIALVNLHVKAIRAAQAAGDAADPLADAVCVALEDQVHARRQG